MKKTAMLSCRAKMAMSFRLTAEHEARQALWRAAACYRLRSSQLAGRGALYRTLGREAASQLARPKRQQAAALQGACGAQARCFERPLRPFSGRSEGSAFCSSSAKDSRCLATLGMTCPEVVRQSASLAGPLGWARTP